MRLPSIKQAFALHFLISLLIFLILLALMMWVWFPGKLFYMDGGWQGLKIIAPIDLVLGPALTLLLYRPWKKSLKFDMSVIALVQVVALSYGVYSAYNQRTAAIVFAENRFETISLNEFRASQEQLKAHDLPIVDLSKFGRMPVVVYAQPYDNYGKYLEDILNGKPELRERSDRYISIKQALPDIAKYSITNEDETILEVPASSKSGEVPVASNRFELKTRYDNGVITVDSSLFNIEQVGH